MLAGGRWADRDTKWTFSVDTFTSIKSTHWKNSNILATRPKVHNSILKVNSAFKGLINNDITKEINLKATGLNKSCNILS